MAAPVTSTVCSLCGQPLEREGDCLACLLRGGLDESEEELLPSSSLVFGDFEIELRDDGSLWELGRGAMGVTYRARDKMLHREVALKVIEVPEGAHATRERFLREARAAAAFRHANVASVFQIGAPTDTGRCYYAMELVEGETLATVVRRDGPLPVAAALDIALQVARALVAAAAHGLIHRDLKPANIMLAPNEAQPAALEAKVIDFGLAKATAEAVDEMDLTHGEFVGTPTFASPEQFAGKAADARSDIYSLGVTLWYALTGEVPYEGKTIEEIRHCQSDLLLPVGKLVARKIPRPVIQLLRRVLAVDPTQRPASARELMEALEACRSRLGLIPAHGLRARQIGRRLAALGAVVAIAGAVFFAFWLRGHKAADPAPAPAKSIAVLPFENRGGDPANAYFADGIQDEILTRLSKIGDLKVISRTSTEKYRSRPIDLKTVAQDLGVSAFLEGSVQKTGGKVRVTVQLIEARSDRHLWAETYDRALDDIFTVQSEIAGQVANALKASLTPQESIALQSVPTRNQKAYDLFLRAEHFLRVGTQNETLADLQKAIELYGQAVAEDTRFALAYARLSKSQSYLRLLGGEPSDQDRANAEKALALQPDLVQAHMAHAYCEFWGRTDYPSALEHLARARALAPESAEVLIALGAVYRRQLRFDEAIAAYERAAQYDPGNSNLFKGLATTCLWAGRNDKVQPNLERALTLDPTNVMATNLLGYFLLQERGDVEGARRVFRAGGPSVQLELAYTYWATRNYEKAVQLIEELPADSTIFEPQNGGSKDQQLGLALHWAGHNERARSLLEPERDRLTALLADKTLSPPTLMYNSLLLAQIEVALGNRDTAVQVAERGAQSDAVTHDVLRSVYYRSDLAGIYAGAGRKDEAITLISALLKARSGFAGITPVMLRLAPTWDPLRNDPRFQALLKEYPTEGDEKLTSEKTIAVLPFENRSEDKANAYFADGIQDEILTRLAKIGDLKVISRTSTEKYRGRPINLKTLAEELSVSAVLEGSVQKAGGKVRVAVHLIEAQSDHPLWAESYDRSLEDVFAVQSEIAGAVASALHATLTPEESVALQNVPTRNQKAYDLFLRAEYFLRIGQGNMSMAKITEAIALYRQALAEDPDFALAYAGLSNAESYVRFIGADPANEPPDQAKIHAEKAAALQPDLVQAHLALAHCESAGRLDYSGALKHLTRAQALAPRSVEVLMSLAGVYRRLLRFNDAIAVLERATQYDPGNPILFADLGTTYTWARRYDRIQPALEHALALNPADDGATLQLAHFLIEQRGDMEGARKLLHGRGQFLQVVLADTYRLTREYEKAISLIEELPADCDAFASSEKSKDQLLGEHMHSAGQDEVARPLLERAREHRITLLADKTLSPRRVSFNSIRLAEIELALGNGQAAVQIAERDAQSDWVTHDPTFLQWYRGFLAKIYADVGRYDEAIMLVSELLKSEFYFTDITPITLRLDPDWDPLRNDPRFQALLKDTRPMAGKRALSHEQTFVLC